MTVREETIVYGDGTEPLTLTVRETHLGPIMNDNSFDDDGNLEGFNNENPLAMRWASTSETGTIFEAIFLLNQAADWDGFREALSFWDSPAQNVVYADVEGNIGYQMPGRFPIRAADHDGLTPVPGWTDEYEWQGFIEYDLLPRTFNPERGYIGSVNQTVADQDYWDALRAEIGADTNVYFQTQVAFGYRGVPLHERLESLAPHTIETFQQIHGDSYSHSAAQLLPYITQHDYGEADFNEYRDWLAEWDMVYTPDSAHALFYAHIWAALVNNLYNDDLPENGLASGNERVQWVTYQLMDDPDNEWWDDATTDTVETRDDILQVSFEEAVNRIVADFGDERDEWRWNAAHQVNLTHNPLGVSGIEVIENVFNRGGYPTGGGDGVLNNMRWSTSSGTFEVQGSVVSMRSIVDFSDFSNSLTIIPTGQSGHPFSPQYDDQIEAWTTLNYHPMHFERGNVEATGGPVLRLEPAS
jgi:penicillin amidase